MITSDDLKKIGWHHVATASNGGSKMFSNRGKGQQNILPLYTIKFNGDNFLYKKENRTKLTEITIEEFIVNLNAEKREDKIKMITHYKGHPTLDELNEEIKKLKQ